MFCGVFVCFIRESASERASNLFDTIVMWKTFDGWYGGWRALVRLCAHARMCVCGAAAVERTHECMLNVILKCATFSGTYP